MKKFAAIILVGTALALLTPSIFAGDTKVVIYADENYPPYSYVEKGEPVGIYTNIVKEAFSRMAGYNIEIKAVPWKRGQAQLKKGTGLALYPPYMNLQKRPWMWPFSLPLVDERVVVFCHEAILFRSLRPNWPEDYYGLTIGRNAGFLLGGEKFTKAAKDGKIKISEAKDNRGNILKLGKKRIDCYLNDRISILWELKKLKEEGLYDEGGKHAKLIEGASIAIEQGFLGFTDKDDGKFSYKDDFLKKFNMAIYDMRKSGELEGIIDDYLRN